MRRPYGTGHIYEKSGAYCGRWRTPDGRQRNRRLGPNRDARARATRLDAARWRSASAATGAGVRARWRRQPADDARGRTVDDAANALRDRLELQGARKSYQPELRVDAARPHLAGHGVRGGSRRSRPPTSRRSPARCSGADCAPKSVRNVITFLHSVFGLAVDRGWCVSNPVARAASPTTSPERRRQPGPAVPHRRRARSRDRGDPERGRPSHSGADPPRPPRPGATASARRPRARAARA